MAKKRAQKAARRSIAPSAHSGEVRGVVLLTVSALTILSLLSFAYGHPASNWLGVLGYTLGGLFYYTLGLGSYVVATFTGWIGWRMLSARPVERFTLKLLACITFTLSLNVLLNLFETLYPSLGVLFGNRLYAKDGPVLTRFHLGGVPLYYLYRDLPTFNLHRILNTGGIALVFTNLLLGSFLVLTQVSVRPFLDLLSRLVPKRREPKAEGEEDTAASLWRYVKLSLGTGQAKTSTIPETLAIKPETELKRRPSLSGKEMTPSQPKVMEKPAAAPSPVKPVVTTSKAPSKRELALQAQRLHNGDLTGYRLPPVDLLTEAARIDQTSIKKDLRRQAEVLEETLQSFGIEAKVGQINCGPTITSFEVHPAIGVKVQKIKALENDIALNMEARSIRIIAPIPGKAAVGIEVPNAKAQEVGFKDMLTNYQGGGQKLRIPLLLGKAVNGDFVISDLAKMPHCIIAGATGSGKSVCINTIVMSIVFNARPDQIKLLMVDPKKVELTPYSKLPHMLAPVITEPQGACAALHWLVKEMESRYELLKLLGVRNIEGFNTRKVDKALEDSLDREIPPFLPYIVGIIDELADLMMVSSHDIETPIARIAQMARAVGIHLILATQRPSREVITGLIKANFPTRISFKVASRVNSQIILDEVGAEALLGNGDMLFLPPASSHLMRAQGAYVRDEDIHATIKFICDQMPPNYAIASFDTMAIAMEEEAEDKTNRKGDALFDQAREVVEAAGNASTTFLQRKLKVGYARAASLMDELEEEGIISPSENGKPRRVLKAPKSVEEAPSEPESELLETLVDGSSSLLTQRHERREDAKRT